MNKIAIGNKEVAERMRGLSEDLLSYFIDPENNLVEQDPANGDLLLGTKRIKQRFGSTLNDLLAYIIENDLLGGGVGGTDTNFSNTNLQSNISRFHEFIECTLGLISKNSISVGLLGHQSYLESKNFEETIIEQKGDNGLNSKTQFCDSETQQISKGTNEILEISKRVNDLQIVQSLYKNFVNGSEFVSFINRIKQFIDNDNNANINTIELETSSSELSHSKLKLNSQRSGLPFFEVDLLDTILNKKANLLISPLGLTSSISDILQTEKNEINIDKNKIHSSINIINDDYNNDNLSERIITEVSSYIKKNTKINQTGSSNIIQTIIEQLCSFNDVSFINLQILSEEFNSRLRLIESNIILEGKKIYLDGTINKTIQNYSISSVDGPNAIINLENYRYNHLVKIASNYNSDITLNPPGDSQIGDEIFLMIQKSNSDGKGVNMSNFPLYDVSSTVNTPYMPYPFMIGMSEQGVNTSCRIKLLCTNEGWVITSIC